MEPSPSSYPLDEQQSKLYERVLLRTIEGSSFIRVLNLHHASKHAPLPGTLEAVDLSQNPVPCFNALSYVWGQNRSPEDRIICNGHDLTITASCHDALQALREKHGNITIWVDAICINQKDENEKAIQVPLMQLIYLKAKSVYIWLGHGNKVYQHGLEVVRAAASIYVIEHAVIVMKRISLSWTWHMLRYITTFPQSWLRLARNLKSLERVAKQEGSSMDQMNFDCEWLHRAWTFQEFMLAENPVFLCGTTEVSMSEMNGMFYYRSPMWKTWIGALSFKKAFSGDNSTTTKASINLWIDVLTQWYQMRILYMRQEPEPRRKINAKVSIP